MAEQIIAALKEAKVPPVRGFVNGIRMREQSDTVHVLEAWRAAGFPLGSHSWSHMNLNQNSLDAAEADLVKNESVLQQQMKTEDWHWYRYPYLAEGDTPKSVRGSGLFCESEGTA